MKQKRFEAIYRLHYEDLLSFAKNHVSDPYQAEDLVQDTFLFFFEHSLNNNSFISCSLYSIFTSLLENHLKQSAPYLSFDDTTFINSENPNYISSLFQTFIRQQLVHESFETLKTLLFQLPKDEQRILMLYFFKKKNAKEISTIIPINHNTIRKKLERSKKKLKEMYLQTA